MAGAPPPGYPSVGNSSQQNYPSAGVTGKPEDAKAGGYGQPGKLQPWTIKAFYNIEWRLLRRFALPAS